MAKTNTQEVMVGERNCEGGEGDGKEEEKKWRQRSYPFNLHEVTCKARPDRKWWPKSS